LNDNKEKEEEDTLLGLDEELKTAILPNGIEESELFQNYMSGRMTKQEAIELYKILGGDDPYYLNPKNNSVAIVKQGIKSILYDNYGFKKKIRRRKPKVELVVVDEDNS